MNISKEAHGRLWCITFLLTDSRLSFEEKEILYDKATYLCYYDQKKGKVKTDTMEGIVYMAKSFALHKCKVYSTIGTFTGIEYHADIDTNDHGSAKLKFLVSEMHNDKNLRN